METVKNKELIRQKIGQLSFLGVINDKETDLLHKLLENDDCIVVFQQNPIVKKTETIGQDFHFQITLRKSING